MVGKGDEKVNTSFAVTFSLPTGEKSVMMSQNIEMADTKESLSLDTIALLKNR